MHKKYDEPKVQPNLSFHFVPLTLTWRSSTSWTALLRRLKYILGERIKYSPLACSKMIIVRHLDGLLRRWISTEDRLIMTYGLTCELFLNVSKLEFRSSCFWYRYNFLLSTTQESFILLNGFFEFDCETEK